MATILSLILSKFGAVILGGLSILGFWLYGRYQKGRADNAEAVAQQAEQVVEVYKADKEIDRETEKEETRVLDTPDDKWDFDSELDKLHGKSAGNAPDGPDADDK